MDSTNTQDRIILRVPLTPFIRSELGLSTASPSSNRPEARGTSASDAIVIPSPSQSSPQAPIMTEPRESIFPSTTPIRFNPYAVPRPLNLVPPPRNAVFQQRPAGIRNQTMAPPPVPEASVSYMVNGRVVGNTLGTGYYKIEPITIMSHDPAPAPENVAPLPVFSRGKEGDYTSRIEYELAATKHKLAQANHELQILRRV